jgi:WD40 repeat protein
MSEPEISLKEVFSRALDYATPVERDEYLAAACAGKAELRREVEALLRAHAGAGSFLDHPAVGEVSPETPGFPLADTAAEGGDSAERISLEFLAPATKPGALGRLDHYEVWEVISQGGMGIVLKAFDEKLHRVVAVKVIAPALAASPLARLRFVREAQAAAAVRHDHVVDIHAVENAGPLPYLVMEYIVGMSLEERVRRSGRLQLREVLRIGMQIAQGLTAAHAQGLVHRDIKPANILLENSVERVKITDFGLARPVEEGGVTLPGLITGTPQFMAPEQARGASVDRRADLFSLGSVLYMMCTGRPPFAAGEPLAVLKRVCDETPAPIRELNPEIPQWLASIVERLHAREPADRLQSAAEVAERLAQGLAHVQEPATLPPPLVPAPPMGPRVAATRPRRRWAAAAMLALVLVAGGAWFGPALYHLAVSKARLEIQTDDPNVVLLVKKGHAQVARLDLRHDADVELDAGDYDLELTEGRGDLRLSERKVTLRSGGHQVVSIRTDPDFVGLVRRFEGHQGPVRSVALAPNGTSLLSASHDRTLRLWDLNSGKAIRPFVGHTNKVGCAVFSRDGKQVLSACDDQTVRIWNTDTAKHFQELRGHTGFVVSVALTPDGHHALTGSYDKTVRLWDLDSGKHQSFEGHKDVVWCVAVSSDGKRALSGSWDGTARVWDIATRAERRQFKRHVGRVWPVAFSPDGRVAASGGGDSKIWLWQVESGKELHCLSGHDGYVVCSLAFSPDGRQLLSGGSDSSVRLWDVDGGTLLHRFDGHRGDVWSVAFLPDGRHALSGAGEERPPTTDNAIILWRLPH